MARFPPAQIVAALVQRGVPEHVAQGVVMNFQDESGLDTGIQEGAPTSGRGGFGLAQWTGPRRVKLEQFADIVGKPVDDLNLQLDYFMAENAGPEAGAWKAVLSQPTANDAAVAFVNRWERPAAQYAAQRSAKYGGADAAALTSPYQLRAQHPGQTTVGTGGYVAPGADTTQVPLKDAVVAAKADDKDKRDKYQEIAAQAMQAFGGMAGGGGGQGSTGMSQIPQMPVQAPMAMESMPIVSPSAAGGGGRDQLAMLMQQLNSGRLWG